MKRSFVALTAVLAVATAFVVTGVVSAHAPITYMEWDTDTNPSRLIAKTNKREMVAEPGSFYVRVYNSSGARVDAGEAVMTPDRLEIHVILQPNLPPGTYRVDWLTTSADGAVLSGSESMPLPGSFGTPPSAEPEEAEEHADEGEDDESEEMTGGETVSPPVTGDGGLQGRRPAPNVLALAAGVVTITGLTILALRRAS
jgi:methionine-rich copper-binding protein CopC